MPRQPRRSTNDELTHVRGTRAAGERGQAVRRRGRRSRPSRRPAAARPPVAPATRPTGPTTTRHICYFSSISAGPADRAARPRSLAAGPDPEPIAHHIAVDEVCPAAPRPGGGPPAGGLRPPASGPPPGRCPSLARGQSAARSRLAAPRAPPPAHCARRGLTPRRIGRGSSLFCGKQHLLDVKRANGKLAEINLPGRYLAAVIQNKDTEAELENTAARLLQLRLRHRDLSLAPLQRRVENICATTAPPDRPRALLDLALSAERLIDFRFYTDATARALEDLEPGAARNLYPHLARRIAVSHKVERRRRERLVATLARTVSGIAA